MKLLIATDHSFLQHHTGVFDNHCFDRYFFDDYSQVFDEVEVICRMERVSELPLAAMRSDGKSVRFIGVPNKRRSAWFLLVSWLSQPVLKLAVERADAVIVRVPSQLGWLAAKYARRMGKPYMIEVIGDPKEMWLTSGRGPLFWVVALVEAHRMQHLASHAQIGCYVSYGLEKTCPMPNKQRTHEVISSIRLEDEIASPRTHNVRRDLSNTYPTPIKHANEIISDIRLRDGDLVSSKAAYETTRPFRLIHVGRLEPRKRCRDLIHATHHLVDLGFNIEVHLAGDGPQRASLEALCKKIGLEEIISFHGHITGKQTLNKLLDESDLFVFTSASEGLPRVIVEAMARGLPVVGTHIPGVDELVCESEMYPVGDTSALATLIMNLLVNPQRLAEMSRYSVQIARQFTHEVLSPRRQRLYRNMLNAAKS